MDRNVFTEKNADKISTEKNTGNIRNIALIGLMAAVICILGPLTIPLPVSPVPLSLTNFAIFISLYVLGAKRGTCSYLIYMLVGFAGLPVFSGFAGGPGKLLGPTGGYIIGFVFLSVISGLIIEKWRDRRFLCFLGMVLGAAVCDGFGTAWLAYQSGMSFGAALAAGVLPFLPGDLAKILLAMILGPVLYKALAKAGLN